MIGNITKGNGFYGCVAYVLGKSDAQLINTNMAGGTPAQLAWEFRSFANKNPRVQKPVLHLSFSPAVGDRMLDEWELCQIGQHLLDGLKLSNNQFILVQHNDAEFDGQPRPHAHMVINRVSYNGECNDDYLDYYRTEKLLRQIEKQYDLIIQPSSWEVQKKKAYPKHIQQAEAEGELNLVERLQSAIEQAAADKPAMPVFVARLLKENIQVDCKFTRTGKLKGISYCLEGQAFKGGDLGKLYTHIGIKEHLKVGVHEDYRHPIESLIESYKRGRTIDNYRINHLQTWIDNRKHSTDDTNSNYEEESTNLELAATPTQPVATTPTSNIILLPTQQPKTKINSLYVPSEELQQTVVSGETTISESEAITPRAILSQSEQLVPPEARAITLLGELGSPKTPPKLEPEEEAMASERPPLRALARLEVLEVATKANSDNNLSQQHSYAMAIASGAAKQIAQTVRQLWERQDLVKKSKKYGLQLGEDNVIYLSRKSGETIASIPLDDSQTPQGIALTQEDVNNFQKIQEILDALKQQTKSSKKASDIEY
ncbi:relaxase/mobilization nuclease domain-containing protein [Scytonema sp. PRP1]|uniref:relaxase/mobilization nuclease domain-containing protein n=1 Tax=Scytonema sp. PRP1 TaxID=3120513 RepID=UPI00300C1107